MSKGIALSIAASVMFGGMYYFASLLAPMNGEEIFGWRVLLTLPMVTVFVWRGGLWPEVRRVGKAARQRPRMAAGLLLSAGLLGVQLWLFLWAPLHGRALQVSLGYFLLPLTMIAAGRLVYRERLTLLQRVAALCAAAGVVNQLWQVGAISWECLVVAGGFPVYFVLRRWLGIESVVAFWLDMAVLAPVALLFIAFDPNWLEMIRSHPKLYVFIPLLGILSATALGCYFAASKLLSFGLFGLLSYLEPVLLVIVALLLGERIAPNEWATYGLIWVAVMVLAVEGGLTLYHRHPPRHKSH